MTTSPPSPAPPSRPPVTGPGRAELIVAGLALVVGVVLRFVADSPMWLDEALSVNIASLDLADLPDALRQDGHPPLYYALLHVWMNVLGSGDAAVRALSGVVGVAAIAVMWVAARRFAGPRAALATTVVVAMSPFAIRYGSEARMYSLVLLLTGVGLIVFDRARESPTPPRLLLLALVTGIALLTHYWSLYVVAVVGSVLLVVAWRMPDRRERALRLAGALTLGGVAFLPWLGVFLHQSRTTGTPWATPARPTQVVAESLVGFAGPFGSEAVLLAMVLTALAVLAVVGRTATDGVLVTRPHDRRLVAVAVVLVGVVALGSVAGLVTNSAFQARYAAWYFPLFALLVGAGIALFDRQVVRVGLLAVVVVLGLASTLLELADDRTQSGVIAEAVLADGGGGDDLVLVCPDQLGPSVHRALDGAVPVTDHPALDDPRRIDWENYEDRHAAADPDQVADTVVDGLAPGAVLYLVWNDSYRVVSGQCSRLVDAFTDRLGRPRPLVAAEPGEYFEHANLFAYPAAP